MRVLVVASCCVACLGCGQPQAVNQNGPTSREIAEYEEVMATLWATSADVFFFETPFEDAIDYLQYKSGLNFRVNWIALEAAAIERDTPVDLRLDNAPLAQVLDKTLERAGGDETYLGYEIRDGCLVISTRHDLPPREVRVQTTRYNDLSEKLARKYRVKPTPDPNSEWGVYIPENLEDCFSELKTMLHPALIDEMKLGTEDDMIHYHFGLGMWMRNNWGLWGDSRLEEYFKKLGVLHADDMSGIVLDSFWRHLNDKPLELDEQIEYYQEYWKKAQEPGNAEETEGQDQDEEDAFKDEADEEEDEDIDDSYRLTCTSALLARDRKTSAGTFVGVQSLCGTQPTAPEGCRAGGLHIA